MCCEAHLVSPACWLIQNQHQGHVRSFSYDVLHSGQRLRAATCLQHLQGGRHMSEFSASHTIIVSVAPDQHPLLRLS
jgi:hypothetical protein